MNSVYSRDEITLIMNSSTDISTNSFLKSAFKENPTIRVYVILEDNSGIKIKGSTQEKLLLTKQKSNYFHKKTDSLSQKNNFKGKNNIRKNVFGFSITVTEKELQNLLEDEDVLEVIYSNPGIGKSFLINSASQINAKQNLWNQGINGTGIKVCIIDSGVNSSHQALLGKVIDQYCFCSTPDSTIGSLNCCPDGSSEGTNANDFSGHGTHVSGIIASQDSYYKGIAFGSNLYVVKVLNSTEYFNNWEDLAAAVDWCVINKSVNVISMSLGNDGEYSPNKIFGSCPITALDSSINNAIENNIPVVIASGNSGYTNGIAYPSCIANVISVGSVTKNDSISYFGNRGSNLKLFAPGGTNKGQDSCPTNDYLCSTYYYGGFIGYSGTSMATPHITGSIALLQQAYSGNLLPSQIESALNISGKPIWDSKVQTGFFFWQKGKYINRVNAEKAVEYIRILDILNTDWPTNRHDNRRTGTTFLKGDMKKADDVDSYNLYLTNASDQEYVIRTSIADLDNNGYMEAVSVSHEKYPVEYHISNGIVFDFERKKKWEVCPSIIPFCWENKKKWTVNVNSSVYHPPTLGNIDSSSRKEVVVARKNSSLLTFDVGSNGENISLLWEFIVPAKYSAYMGNSYTGELSGSAISDVDLDGSMDIIITDWLSRGDHTWPAQVYVIDSNGNHKFNATFGNGGAFGSPSIANLDDDDFPEIVVPSFYGVYVFDYDSVNNNLSLKWNNTDGLIDGEIVVYDVDRDNEYELVYSTGTEACSTVNFSIYGKKQCYNRTYIRDAKTGVNEGPSPINYNKITRVAPTIANLDSDSNMEIVTLAFNQKSSISDLGQVIAYDSVTGNQEWVFNNSDNLRIAYSSPDIADITGDGNSDIIIAENNGTTVYILNKNGTIAFTYSFSAFVDNALAIGDLDKDGKAEIALKRAGSPVAFASLSGFNEPPEVLNEFNITAVAGDLININSSGKVSAIDPDGNVLSYSYSSPFNSSGYWQTTINDTGNYTILVEASDGNLSSYKFVSVLVFDSDASKIVNFSDGSGKKLLNFSQGNQSVQVRIPKKSSILYSRLKVGGFSS